MLVELYSNTYQCLQGTVLYQSANQDYITCVRNLAQIQSHDYKIVILSGCQNEPGARLEQNSV